MRRTTRTAVAALLEAPRPAAPTGFRGRPDAIRRSAAAAATDRSMAGRLALVPTVVTVPETATADATDVSLPQPESLGRRYSSSCCRTVKCVVIIHGKAVHTSRGPVACAGERR